MGKVSDFFAKRFNNFCIYVNYVKVLFVSFRKISGDVKCDVTDIMERYRQYTEANKGMKYHITQIDIPPINSAHKWVGGVYYNGQVFGIPNDADCILVCDVQKEDVRYIGHTSKETFKWTGGCIWKDLLYSFPRKALECFQYDLVNNTEIHSGDILSKEHHYGGVCTPEGVVFQPPRDSDYIQIWDLINKTSNKIQIANSHWKVKYRYCGSVYHPNGYIYMLPERYERVIKINANTLEWGYIGRPICAMVFDAKVAVDGNIYGYSAYGKGMLKIDVTSDTVSKQYKKIFFGAFGTKIGVDGHLYSIPGDGDMIWEYDVEANCLRAVYKLNETGKAKYAGGATTPDGSIVGIPAEGFSVLCMKTAEQNEIPQDLYEKIYKDEY